MALIKYFRSHSKSSFENTMSSTVATNTTKEITLLQEKVFENPLTLQVILKHVLQNPMKTNENGNLILCTKAAQTLRLVCRAWLLEVNSIFHKSGQPLLFLTNRNIRQFLVSPPKERNNWFPPLSLSLSLKSFSFNCVTLPRTINRMETNPRLSLASLVLQRSAILENMRFLKLDVLTKNYSLEKEDISILRRMIYLGSSSLEELELGITWALCQRNKDLKVALNFPKMVKLKRVKFYGKIWHLGQKSLEGDLGERLPKMEELEIWITSGDIFFREWCRSSVFRSVRVLKLVLFNNLENAPYGGGVLFSWRVMQKVFEGFPQVIDLHLGWVDIQELDGLRYIFGEMVQLKKLHLYLKGEIVTEDEIDGLLIGAGPEMARRLKEDPTSWKGFLKGDLEKEWVYTKSIRNLRCLETLILDGDFTKRNEQGRVEPLKNLSSDLAFELGFIRLPVLSRLVLVRSFGVKEEMAEKWRKRKEIGTITYEKQSAENGWMKRLMGSLLVWCA